VAGSTALLQPKTLEKRIFSIDVLRGLAVLGILIMNIQSYALPASAYINPTSYDPSSLVNYDLWVYLLSHIFANGKFLAIFSMLFGAGIIMISNKAKKEQMRSGELQSKRLLWLLIIGILHAYLLWYGDILVAYAICGFFMFMFRSRRAKTLFRLGILFLVIGSAISLVLGYSVPFWELAEFEQLRADIWLPTAESHAEEIEFYRSNWERQMFLRAPKAFEMQTVVFLSDTFWKVSGLMLLGMAFYKKRVFTAKQSRKYYRKMVIYGIGLGLPLVAIGLIVNFHYDWEFRKSYYYFSQLNYWGSVLMAIGYIGFIMILVKLNATNWIFTRLSQVGKLALTNYLMQSVICSFIFYGHGMAMFADLDRAFLALIVLAIWLIQIAFSHFWLSFFRFGLFEWVWRSLTYGKFQPMIR